MSFRIVPLLSVKFANFTSDLYQVCTQGLALSWTQGHALCIATSYSLNTKRCDTNLRETNLYIFRFQYFYCLGCEIVQRFSKLR